MCAIVDANAASEVFGDMRPPAGKAFFDWIDKGSGRLVVGGKLKIELAMVGKFKEWAVEADRSGRLKSEDDSEIDCKALELASQQAHKSNDPHIIALAQVSGARLLYSKDLDLHQDFKNKKLIDHPRGKVYSTLGNNNFTTSRRRMLVENVRLCRNH